MLPSGSHRKYMQLYIAKELILDNVYFWRVWGSQKEWILDSFYIGMVWWPWKDWISSISTLGGCGSLEMIDFKKVNFERMWRLWKHLFEVIFTLGGFEALKGQILNYWLIKHCKITSYRIGNFCLCVYFCMYF